MSSQKKVLFLCQYYFPGNRAGGPQQTISNIVEIFGDNVDFYILTLNHDLGEINMYPGIEGGWNQVGKAKVMYLTDNRFNYKTIIKYSEEVDLIYACGLFENCVLQALLAYRLKKIELPLYVAPMGVFSKGAFNQKRLKKELFIRCSKLLKLFKPLIWSFTSVKEKMDAERVIGKVDNFIIAEDLPRPIVELKKHKKLENELKIIFLSRICVQKNLVKCLNIINRHWKGRIVFDIYGPKEDIEYWRKCKEIIKNFPENVKCSYCGQVESKQVLSVFAKYDVFLFPTLGENFGHVIYEALVAGCIPIISDQTPWQDLDIYGCGKVISLEDTQSFVNALDKYLKMTSFEFERVSKNAKVYAQQKYNTSVTRSGYKKIFYRI